MPNRELTFQDNKSLLVLWMKLGLEFEVERLDKTGWFRIGPATVIMWLRASDRDTLGNDDLQRKFRLRGAPK